MVEMECSIEKLSMIWAKVLVYFMYMSFHFPAMYMISNIAKHAFLKFHPPTYYKRKMFLFCFYILFLVCDLFCISFCVWSN